MVVPFGTTLHVSGADEPMLRASLSPYFDRAELKWVLIEPGLEDVFIELMGQAKDNYQ